MQATESTENRAVMSETRTVSAYATSDYDGATFVTVETRTTKRVIRNGWGVAFSLVYGGDDEPNPDEPVAFSSSVVRLHLAGVREVGGTMCVKVEDGYFVPAENFGDDEDDLTAARWFASKEDAEEHRTYARRRLVQNGLTDDSV